MRTGRREERHRHVALVAAAVLTAAPDSAGVGAGDVAAVAADPHLADGSAAPLDDAAAAAERRTTKSNTSDYLKVVLKEAS